MRTTLKLLAVFALLLVAFSPYTDVPATNVFKYKGQGVYAQFFSVDPSECARTSIGLFGLTDIQRPAPGVRDPLSEVHISFDQYNQCTDTQIGASGSAPLSKSNFKIGAYLESARLTTKVTLYDWYTGAAFDLYLDLTWNGISGVSHRITHEVLSFMSCHYNRQAKEDLRYAQVTGTISAGDTNFTPNPSIDGALFSAKTGQIWHGCQ